MLRTCPDAKLLQRFILGQLSAEELDSLAAHVETCSDCCRATPAYMAPEQATSQPVDARADLFSLGCVLYRLATGELPFKGDDTMAVLMALALQNPTPPEKIVPDLPSALCTLITQHLIERFTNASNSLNAGNTLSQ